MPKLSTTRGFLVDMFSFKALKKYSFLFTLLCVFFTVFPPFTYAQSVDTLSLQRAIDLAQKQNLNVALSQFEVKQSEARLREIRASRYPSIMLHSYYLHAPEVGYSETVTNGGEYGLQLSTSLPIYDGGVRGILVDQSILNHERASFNVDKKRIEIAFTVRSLYYDILRAQEEFRIRSETVERLHEYISLLKQLRLGGSGTESDLLKAQVDANNAGVLLEQARQSLQKSRMLFATVLGAPMDRPFEILLMKETDSTPLQNFSIEMNPDVQLLHRDVQSAKFEVAIASAERLPTLTITGDAGALGIMPSEFHHDIGYSILLSLDVPIFNWGATSNRIEQKELAREQIETQLRLIRRDLETEWSLAVSDLELARKNLTSLNRNITDAEQNFLSAKSRFVGGSGSSLEVLDAQRLLVETKLSYAQTLFQLRSDIAVLLKLGGQQ